MSILKANVSLHGGDYDCSEVVRQSAAAAGIIPWGYWDSYMWTGNEIDLLTTYGFVERDLAYPQVGDVLWRKGHTEIYLGDGMQGGARHGDAPGGLTGRVGDQDGTEITRSAYNRWEWTKLLRYEGNANVNGIPAPMVMKLVADHIIDHNSHGYSQYNRAGDGTVETIEIAWDDGKAAQGWKREGGKWYYYENGKRVAKRWVQDGGFWYYLGEDGAMYRDKWVKDGGYWYYLGHDGIMVKGYNQCGTSDWYYFDGAGRMLSSQPVKHMGGLGWCWLGKDGKCVQSGTLKIEKGIIVEG